MPVPEEILASSSALADELECLFRVGEKIKNPKHGATVYRGIGHYHSGRQQYQAIDGSSAVYVEIKSGVKVELFLPVVIALMKRQIANGLPGNDKLKRSRRKTKRNLAMPLPPPLNAFARSCPFFG